MVVSAVVSFGSSVAASLAAGGALWTAWLAFVVTCTLYCAYVSRRGTSMEGLTHQQKCDRIRQQILQWNALPADQRRPLCTARSRSLTIRAIGLYKAEAQRIDFRAMDQVVSIDTAARVMRVEPQIDMDQLTRVIVPTGWTIPVVPELKMLTVGGLIMGIGIESSSHRYGLFHNTVRACTIILADGTVKTVSRTNEPDLFRAIFFSAGSWCFLLSVDLDIVKIDPYVRVDYTPYSNSTDLIRAIERVTTSGRVVPSVPDFVEGLLFSETSGVLCCGRYVPASVVDADRSRRHTIWWYSRLYYAIVRDDFSAKREGKPMYQYLSARDYYFRHDRGLFWALELVGSAVHWFLFRLVFGKALDFNAHIRDLFPSPVWSKEETETAWERVRMVSDAVVPLNGNTPRVFNELQRLFEIYPVWLCPSKLHTDPNEPRDQFLFNFAGASATDKAVAAKPEHKSADSDADADDAAASSSNSSSSSAEPAQYLDIGLYGVPHSAAYKRDHVFCQRAMEHITRRERGFMFPYSVGYSTRAEYWRTYDHARYEAIRKRTGAVGAFVDVYTKLGGGAKVERWIKANPAFEHATNPDVLFAAKPAAAAVKA